MTIKETNFIIDLTRESRHPVVKFRLNDNRVQRITFRLKNNGREININKELGDIFTPVFECIFKDKTFKRDENKDNWIVQEDRNSGTYLFTYKLTKEVLNKSGIACYYFALETPEGLRISTPTLKMVIDCDFKEDGKPSDNYVSEFEKLLKEAERVKETIEGLDTILKEVIAGGTSITEVIEARTDRNGNYYSKLKDRLDSEQKFFDKTNKEVVDARIDFNNKTHDSLSGRLYEGEKKTNNVVSEVDKARNSSDGEINPDINERINRELMIIRNRENAHLRDIGVTEHIAHRGLSWEAPENTMIAWKMATSRGFDSWECDVAISSDNVPVVIHDDTLERTTNGTGRVDAKTVSELQALDASKLKPYYSGARIPTFEEFCLEAHGNSKKIYPEIKNFRNMEDVARMVKVVIDTGWEEKCVFQSFYPHALEEVRKHTKKAAIGYLVSNVGEYNERFEYAKNDSNAYMLANFNVFKSDPSLVKKTYDAGVDIGVWTTDFSVDIQIMKQLGITKFMSNKVVGVL